MGLATRRTDAFLTCRSLVKAGITDEGVIAGLLGVSPLTVATLKNVNILEAIGNLVADAWLSGAISNAALDSEFIEEFHRQLRG